MFISWLWLSIFQSGLNLLRYQISHHITSAKLFLQQVLSRFGACVECLIDQGSKFRGEFQDLLDCVRIDHCQTSRDHPQSDGLAESMVQMCKKGLRKICLTRNKEDWDLAFPYIAWVIRCLNMPFCFIFLLIFFFLGDIPFHHLPLLFKWTKLWTWTP